jgi:hypothetical protein
MTSKNCVIAPISEGESEINSFFAGNSRDRLVPASICEFRIPEVGKVLAIHAVDNWSARVTGADSSSCSISALDGIVDGLLSVEGPAARDGHVLGVEISQITRSLPVGQNTV